MRPYKRTRLILICSFMAANLLWAIWDLHSRRYPSGLGPALIFIPALLREMDLKNDRPLRRLGSFEKSCFIAGVLWLVAFPALFILLNKALAPK